MKKHLSTFFLILILLGGVALLLYPTVSDYWNSFHQSMAIANYDEEVSNLSEADYERIWNDAVNYNQRLLERPFSFTLSNNARKDYQSQLSVSGSSVMGYIEIPKINVSLPVYHGTSESVLQVAVGHIEGTSLPVGGPSTHCVLSGHRGLPSATLFTNLDQLKEGDLFVLRILNETLTYEVDQIHIVLPAQVDDLAIVEGKDYCTLVTCTPYGINSHRMLVRGHRTENVASNTVRVTSEAIRIDPILVAPITAVPMLLVLLVFLLRPGGGKKGKKGGEKKGKKSKKAKKKKKRGGDDPAPEEQETAPDSGGAPGP